MAKKMVNRDRKYRRRLFFLMLSVIIPSLVIGITGVLSISHQKRAREISLQERYARELEIIRQDMENKIGAAVGKPFLQLAQKPVPSTGAAWTDSFQPVLKQIILANPVVKYPFLVDVNGEFVFPISQKSVIPFVPAGFPGITSGELAALYRRAERLEFQERAFREALKNYVKCLSLTGVQAVKPYIFNAMARCYFKLHKYPQAMRYYTAVIDARAASRPGAQDFSLYFNGLRQLALCYKNLGHRDQAVETYLELYDEILQYEISRPAERFAFFKNEALEYVHRNVSSRTTTKRFRELADPEVSLNWRYLDYDIDSQVGASALQPPDTFRLLKIQEFYLTTDEKTQFYKTLKDSGQWRVPGAGDPSRSSRGFDWRLIENPVVNTYYDVVFKEMPGELLGAAGRLDKYFFGFMVSRDALDDIVKAPGIPGRRLEKAGLHLVLRPGKGGRPAGNDGFPLLTTDLKEFFPGRGLALYADQKDFFARQAKAEIRSNYLLMTALLLALSLGIVLFYRYLSREAELVRLKSDFTDSASHTLKTPLTRIRMLAEKVHLGWVSSPEKRAEYLQAILSETDRLNEMITNMLDFSRIEAGRKRYTFNTISLAGLVTGVLDSYTPYIQNLGFTVQAQIDDTIPPFFMDAEAIRLIVVNLLQNAVKYSLSEKFIGIRLFREKDLAVLTVEDRGLGIGKKEQKRIFGRFYRSPDSAAQAVGGSGLGLYLVEHAVSAHHGRIAVSSEPGKGSRFTVYLPISSREEAK